jgi:hypothetical protein
MIDHKLYGVTQDPKTKNYMIIINNKCKKCKHVCDAIHFRQNFGDWSSHNKDTQPLFYECQALKWVPYERFYNIEYIAKGGFGKVYKAIWTDSEDNIPVALKSLNNSKNITLEFMNEV